MALPKITYGLNIWYTPPTKPIWYTKNTGSVGILRNLQKAQIIATTPITGTLRSAPTNLLDAHAGLLRMELVLMKACHRAMTRMLTLPNSHPLHNTIMKAKWNPPDKHLSPLDQLIKIFKMRNLKLETIDLTVRNKAENNTYTMVITKSREDSISFEHYDIADYKYL